MNKFLEYYKDESIKLNNYITKFNQKVANKENKFLKENLDLFGNLNTDGKLIRGTLINLGYKILNGSSEYSYPLATSYEVFQTAILVHDDIIDHDDLRRGKPTIHAYNRNKYLKLTNNMEGATSLGNSIGICLGDYGFYSSIKIISDSYRNDKRLGKVLSYYSDIVLKTIDGELLDVITPFRESNQLPNVTLEEDIMEVYKLKTAYYTIIGPLSLGLLLAGVEEDKLSSIYEYGYNVGVAFQLQDDLLGIYGDNIGKVIGSDIKEFKTTLLYSYTKKNKALYDQLLKVYGTTPTEENVEKVRQIFKESKAKEHVENMIEKLYNKSIDTLNKIEWIKEEDKEILRGFVEYLKDRKK